MAQPSGCHWGRFLFPRFNKECFNSTSLKPLAMILPFPYYARSILYKLYYSEGSVRQSGRPDRITLLIAGTFQVFPEVFVFAETDGDRLDVN